MGKIFLGKLTMREIWVITSRMSVRPSVLSDQGALATTTGTATKTSSKNINSRYCNHFETIPSFVIRQKCSSPWGMKSLWTALNLGKKMKIYLHVLTSSIKPQTWQFHVVLSQTTAKKWTKMKNARAERAKLLFLPPINMQICLC